MKKEIAEKILTLCEIEHHPWECGSIRLEGNVIFWPRSEIFVNKLTLANGQGIWSLLAYMQDFCSDEKRATLSFVMEEFQQ